MIKVLIVDDSKLVRQILGEVIASFPDMKAVGAAKDAFEAREMIKSLDPDVITLDVEMPKMDGITFLRNLMRLRPMPVVMLSTLTQQGADTTLEALEVGAVDFISKPRSTQLLDDLTDFSEELHQKLKLAAQVNLDSRQAKVKVKSCQFAVHDLSFRHQIIALGASTGGTEALREVLAAFPKKSPAILITQHIPESFSARFALRLNEHCQMKVLEATDSLEIIPGHIYVAPGSHHLTVEFVNNQYLCRLSDAPPCNRHKPSVDVMYDSLAKIPSVKIFAGLLTGMGNDGAHGLKRLKEKGHYSLIQDQATSMIWGMPGAAFHIGAHQDVVPLSQVAPSLINKIIEQMEMRNANE